MNAGNGDKGGARHDNIEGKAGKRDSEKTGRRLGIKGPKDNPKPTESEIREYLEGNICRCTGYHNIVKAILAASGQDVPAIAAE